MQHIFDTTITHLQKGNSILYPTDTVWGIGCDATNVKAVDKIYKIKHRKNSKSFIILVSSFSMLENYISTIPKEIRTYLSKKNKSTTVIYNGPKNLAKNVIAMDNTIAIRIIKDGFLNKLITEFGKPIVSTSANISNEKSPKNYLDIDSKIIREIDYTVLPEVKIISKSPSKIIKFTKGTIITLRD